MLKSNLHPRAQPQLSQLERFFINQITLPEQKITPIDLPFFNFVCYAIDMMSTYLKSHLQITFNVFLVDQHLRRYRNGVELYRRFMGFIGSWRKYGECDQGKLLSSFLGNNRNQKKNIKLFLKLRKILLKNLNQKILQEINLTHQDVVTIIHTLDILTQSQRKQLTKKINDHFITQNVKYLNTVVINAAVLCQHLMIQINDRENQDREKYNSNLSNKISKILKNQLDFVEEFSDEKVGDNNIWLCGEEVEEEEEEGLNESNSRGFNLSLANIQKQNIQRQCEGQQSKKSLVNLQKCMKELSILKQKDLEIDNRFRRINKSKAQFFQ